MAEHQQDGKIEPDVVNLDEQGTPPQVTPPPPPPPQLTFEERFPPTKDIPVDLRSKRIYQQNIMNLEKICTPFFKRIKKNTEKLAARSAILQRLKEHKDNGTFPPEIPHLRKPQVPFEFSQIFNRKFERTEEAARKEILDHLISVRTDDEKAIKK